VVCGSSEVRATVGLGQQGSKSYRYILLQNAGGKM
jgi:hypothetical protein